MTSKKCVRCGFLNLGTDDVCFKCGSPLVLSPISSADQPYFPLPSHGLDSIWRKQSVLIMTKQALLPDRCVKCNAPAFGRKLKRKLTWHHPALYLLIFAGALFYLIIALVMRKSATIDVGFCELHSAARRQSVWITWTLGLLSLLSFFVAAQLDSGTFLLVGIGLLVATLVYGVLKLRVVVPTKIDEHFVWLNGINPNYLQEFPEWRGSH